MYSNQSTGNSIVPGTNLGAAQPPQQYNGLQQDSHQQQQQQQNNQKIMRKKPYVRITEQPASKALRFRYECEGRSAGSIPGVNSTPENKTYPSIEICNYKGRAVVVVSCVTKDAPYRPHPHNLVGKEGCKKGVCTLEINSETMRAVFSNLGIQCVKKKDIESALKAREEIRVDPFKTGFSHRFQPSSIDLNSVRLCFQVFMESEQKGRFTQPLPPVVSEPIFDKKAMSDLVICRLCNCSASVLGNTQIILLCEKVAKEDIAIRFFEEKNGQVIWEAYGEFQHNDVHKQTAITFKTPRYHSMDITEPAKVFIQLKRPSDGITSEALPFEYVPLDSDPAHLRRKRQKTGGDPMHLLLQQQQKPHQNDHPDGRLNQNVNRWNEPNIPSIKTEPGDSSPQFFAQYRVPPQHTPSPQPLSPSNNYNQNQQPASPYHMANAATGATAIVGNQMTNPQMISPNTTNYNGIAGRVNANHHNNNNTLNSPMDIQDYNAFTQQHLQQQQQQQQQQQHLQQQQHPAYQIENPFSEAASAAATVSANAQWQAKFAVASATVSNNMSNLNNANPFNMHNLLTHQHAGGGDANSGGGGGTSTHWNLMPNHMQTHLPMQQHMLQQQHQLQQQQQQQQYQQHNTNEVNTHNEGPTISNLLSLNSEQYLRINSEDQQLLRLNEDDLQISNLSITS